MELSCLTFTGDAEENKILHDAIEKLPKNTIRNLSAYEPGDVSLEKDNKKRDLVQIKNDPHEDWLDLDLSDPGFKEIKIIKDQIYFTYKGTRYSVIR